MFAENLENATPIDPNEMNGLKLSHITTKREIDKWEQDNILEAFDWMDLQKPDDLITEKFIMELHRRMFCNVWEWAGSYEPDELAVRFHHRLVSINIFPNGNGRHARMMADLIVERIYKKAPFSWGSKDLSKKSIARKRYIDALKQADQNNYADLIEFARS